MANYKKVDAALLDAGLTAVADAIRAKGGTTEALAFPDGFSEAIQSLETAGETVDTLEQFLTGGIITYESDIEGSLVDYAFWKHAELEEVSFPRVTELGINAFNSCTGLRRVSIPQCTQINLSAFQGCTSLTEVYDPSMKRIRTYGFSGCTSLTRLDAYNTSMISDNAFQNCAALETLILRFPSYYCTISNVNVFAGTPIESGTGYVYVPAALMSQYQNESRWSTFASQLRAIEDYPEITGGA